MITQVELDIVGTEGRNKVYWVGHQPFENQKLAAGSVILLAEEGTQTPLTIKRTFVSLADGCELPPRSRVGTLLEILGY